MPTEQQRAHIGDRGQDVDPVVFKEAASHLDGC